MTEDERPDFLDYLPTEPEDSTLEGESAIVPSDAIAAKRLRYRS